MRWCVEKAGRCVALSPVYVACEDWIVHVTELFTAALERYSMNDRYAVC
jgi:hypothetical protein